ncbi:Nucleolar protein,Nop52 [Aphelenchoides fujianensis]|nr:Nucleolar protein,Nop52 [Aphelenchoides fujianensis]
MDEQMEVKEIKFAESLLLLPAESPPPRVEPPARVHREDYEEQTIHARLVRSDVPRAALRDVDAGQNAAAGGDGRRVRRPHRAAEHRGRGARVPALDAAHPLQALDEHRPLARGQIPAAHPPPLPRLLRPLAERKVGRGGGRGGDPLHAADGHHARGERRPRAPQTPLRFDLRGGAGLCGRLSPAQVITFLRPYAALMRKPNASNYLFGSVCTEVFGTILERFAADLEKEEEFATSDKLDGDAQLKGVGEPLSFDYAVVEADTTPSKRKKRVERMVKQFEKAAHGENPFAEIIIPPKKDPIGKDRVVRAAEQLGAQTKKIRRERVQFKKDKKKLRKRKELTAY